jgi:cobalt/nickel transport system permease protein
MHISEGILTGPSMAVTLAAGILAVGWGTTRVQALVKDQPQRKPLLAMAGAFIFLLSLIPIPAFSGMTTTHPCGTPLAAILLGPGPTIVLSGLTMLLQALFFAHGGLSSLGANTINLGLLGGLSGWMAYRLARRSGLGIFASGALAGFIGDLMVYAGAGGMLATHLAFFVAEPKMGLWGYLAVIYAAYVPVQAPIALGEAVLTGVALRSIGRQRPEVLEDLKVERKGFAKTAALGLLLALMAAPVSMPAAFTGLDEKVNESLAESGGAPPRDPLINTEAWGDLWNTLLLLSGGVAGFLIGRHWDRLFIRPDTKRKGKG